MASAGGVSRSRRISTDAPSPLARFVVCIDPGDHDDLQARRIYRVIPDPAAARSAWVRVIDDSGEDYLYPERLFLPITLPADVREVMGRLSAE